ncbi:MAG: hypothetical protein M3N54_09040 [Acidobacteriota bacterium]|nr:hypothetical protein [Acidobacteriota bacterium]
MKTVAAVFPSMDNAEHVAAHLEKLGIPHSDIHIVGGNAEQGGKEETGRTESTITGARVGGGIGILASLVALAIPGVGPIIAGGGMATVLTGLGVGAAAGGLVGAFKNLGISHEEAELYEQAVRRGGVFIAVHVNNEAAEDQVSALMERHGAQDLRHESEKWGGGTEAHPDPSNSSIKWHEEPENVPDSPARVRKYPFQKVP